MWQQTGSLTNNLREHMLKEMYLNKYILGHKKWQEDFIL